MSELAHVDEWTGRDVSVAEIEGELAQLRTASQRDADHGPDLRTSVMTHMAWVPEDWVAAATQTLAGLAERHPSRTILLIPDPRAKRDALDAEVSLRCFAVRGQESHVCSEVIELRLRGARSRHPASIVEPLLIPDLPVFLRWRGRLPFDEAEFDELVGVTDRLVVDSLEWGESVSDLTPQYERLVGLFEQAAVSDIAWSRSTGWRLSLAGLWPAIAEIQRLSVTGPAADALLLGSWLRARLDRHVELELEPAEELSDMGVDGEPVAPPRGETPSASDLLSEHLDIFGRDRIYEEAARTAVP